ncbi:hypothetical protein MPLA_20013 [Mesorhizobium sp. ORS 3359]|nr:hypothetical protein MPLA_20013 [Mesorhizobium sp. ORS 3359]
MTWQPGLPGDTDFVCIWVCSSTKSLDRITTDGRCRGFQDRLDGDEEFLGIWPVHIEGTFTPTEFVTVELADIRIRNGLLQLILQNLDRLSLLRRSKLTAAQEKINDYCLFQRTLPTVAAKTQSPAAL